MAPLRYALFSRLFGDCIVQAKLHTRLRVHVDRDQHLVTLGDRVVDDLAPLPFGLLDYLERYRDRACSRAELIQHLYPDESHEGSTGSADGRLDTVVTRLRKAIEADPKAPQYVITVRGHGYRLADGQSGD